MKSVIRFNQLFAAFFLLTLAGQSQAVKQRQLLNVSYDATREFYHEFNQSYARYWQQGTGQKTKFYQSHGGSGKQGRAVATGLRADVVTLALANDIDQIVRSGQIRADWQKQFPRDSSPYTSTMVFMVRKGNPKKITDWNDLTRPGIEIITPNPKTGGAPRWIYLSAWTYALKQPQGNNRTARDLVSKLYRNVKVLDSASRGSMTTFAERGIGDVLLTWENEALITTRVLGKDKFDIVYPSISMLAQPAVAIVDRTVKRNGNYYFAKGYINYMYSPLGQHMAARHFFRPSDPAILKKYSRQFPPMKTYTVNEIFGGWKQAQQIHFANGGTFDQIYNHRR